MSKQLICQSFLWVSNLHFKSETPTLVLLLFPSSCLGTTLVREAPASIYVGGVEDRASKAIALPGRPVLHSPFLSMDKWTTEEEKI